MVYEKWCLKYPAFLYDTTNSYNWNQLSPVKTQDEFSEEDYKEGMNNINFVTEYDEVTTPFYSAGKYFGFPDERNPLRIDIKESKSTDYIKIQYADFSSAITMGLDITDIVILCRLTSEDDVQNLHDLFQTQKNFKGQDAMGTVKDPEVVPLMLFHGALDGDNLPLVRWVYIDSFQVIREGKMGDNIFDVQLVLKDIYPHAYRKAYSKSFVENLVFNGRFELGSGSLTSDGWIGGEEFGWYFRLSATATKAEYDETVSYTGNKSLLLHNTDATGKCIVDNDAFSTRQDMAISVSASTQYKFSAMVKTDDVNTDAVWITAHEKDSSYSQVTSNDSSKLSGTNDWTELSTTFTTNASTTHIRIVFNNDVAGSGTNKAWFDNASLYATSGNDGTPANISITNNGKSYTIPSSIKITGKSELDFVDQQDLSTGSTYTLQTSINEGATHRQTFETTKENGTKITFDVDTDGGQTITITVHDSSNNSLVTGTLATGNTGKQTVDVPYKYTVGTTYHFHATVPSGTSKIVSGTLDDCEDAWFKGRYAEHTQNCSMWNNTDSNTVLEIGKESIDQKQEYDDGDAGDIFETISGTQDHIAQTFKPQKTSISKIAIKGRTANTPANLECRITEWDTDYGTTIGNTTYWRTYLSPHEFSTTDAWVYAGNWFYTTDGSTFSRKDVITGLDTTKTYLVSFGLTTNGADGTEYVLRKYGSSDLYSDGDLYVDGVIVTADDLAFKTYYPDSIATPILSDAEYTLYENGNGKIIAYLVQANATKDWNNVNEVSGSEYDSTNSQWDIVTDNDYNVWKIVSPHPMKSGKIKTITIRADGRIALYASTDDSTYTMFKIFDNSTETTYTDISIGSDFDNETTLYIKAEALATDANMYISDMDFEAQSDTSGATFPALNTSSNTLKSSYDEIGSNLSQIDINYRERD